MSWTNSPALRPIPDLASSGANGPTLCAICSAATRQFSRHATMADCPLSSAPLRPLRIAVLLRDDRLQAHYRARAIEHGGAELAASAADPSTAGRELRWQHILAHVDRLTTDPNSARREHIDALLASGLSPRAVIALSQLVAYVNFQARVRAGLRLLGSQP